MSEKSARLMRNLLFVMTGAVLSFCVMQWRGCGKCRNDSDAMVGDTIEVKRDTVFLHDTVEVNAPTPIKSSSAGDLRVKLPVEAVETDSAVKNRAGTDSVDVTLPVVVRHYGDSLYDAWISGPLDPRLDSLKVYRHERIVTETVRIRDPPRRWGLSVGVGACVTPQGRIEPAAFVGATYTFVTF